MKGDTDRLVTIIKDIFTPLLEFNASKNGAVELTVVRGTPNNIYMIISYVWLGGLGNFGAN